jgi:hypothetical protein
MTLTIVPLKLSDHIYKNFPPDNVIIRKVIIKVLTKRKVSMDPVMETGSSSPRKKNLLWSKRYTKAASPVYRMFCDTLKTVL